MVLLEQKNVNQRWCAWADNLKSKQTLEYCGRRRTTNKIKIKIRKVTWGTLLKLEVNPYTGLYWKQGDPIQFKGQCISVGKNDWGGKVGNCRNEKLVHGDHRIQTDFVNRHPLARYSGIQSSTCREKYFATECISNSVFFAGNYGCLGFITISFLMICFLSTACFRFYFGLST